MAGLLWPAGTEPQARANLRQLLAGLRRGAGDLLTEDDGALRLCPDLGVLAGASGPLLGELAYDDAPEFAQWLTAHQQRGAPATQTQGGLHSSQAGCKSGPGWRMRTRGPGLSTGHTKM
jgi:hypothetical protein